MLLTTPKVTNISCVINFTTFYVLTSCTKTKTKVYNAQFSLMDPFPKPSRVLLLHTNKNQKLFNTSNNSQWHLHLLLLHVDPRLLHNHFVTSSTESYVNNHTILSSIF